MAPLPAGHAIITGGSSGIGLALARQLAASGWSLTLIARRPALLAEAEMLLTPLLCRAGQRLMTLPADVGDAPALRAALDRAMASLGVPDLLITSAGLARPGYFAELPDDAFETLMRVNYFGTLTAIRVVAPAMAKNGGGRIVLISSGAGLIGIFGYSAYSPTKFALRGLAESLRGELARDKIRLSVAYPPDTDTPQLVEENRIKPIETKRITAAAAVWSADSVARTILAGVASGRFAITPGWELTLLHRLSGLMTPILEWHFDRIARKS